MVKAMYSGVSGLKAHQSKMDVIGNNIANVNTWGYKSMDTSFKESIYSMVNSGSAGSTADGGYGGVNPSVVGYGSMVSAITANFTSGNQVPTGKNLDLYIDGTAFFAVGPMFGEGEAKAPGDIFLSRVGDFSVVNGYLVDSNGRYVYGSSMSQGGKDYEPGPITKKTIEREDVEIDFPNQKYKDTGDGILTIYGDTTPASDGKHMVEYKYKYNNGTKYDFANPTEKSSLLAIIYNTGGGGTIPPNLTDEQLAEKIETYNRNLLGNNNNKIFAVVKDSAGKITEVKEMVYESEGAKSDRPLPETKVKKDPVTGVVKTWTYEAGTTAGKMNEILTTVTPADEDAERKGSQFDDGRYVFDPETGGYKMMDTVTTLKPLKIPTTCTYYDDEGVLHTEEDIVYSSITIQKDGMIYGTSTASSRLYRLGCVGLVNVDNPSGMTKADGPYYQMSDSAGQGTIVAAGGATGALTSGYLESANVDIATEFSSMITTQRGFQANSKIITVTDEMLQELVNMKR